jgi:hypothetical protein
MTGDLWIGDVGQNRYEGLHVLRPAQQKGANLGWSMFEGTSCCQTQDDRCGVQNPGPCDPAAVIMPQDVRTQNDGWESIIAGQTYRGTCYPDIVGWHFYTDYSKGGLYRARLNEDDTLEIVQVEGSFPGSPASLHEDARGELYETTVGGEVFHIEAGP